MFVANLTHRGLAAIAAIALLVVPLASATSAAPVEVSGVASAKLVSDGSAVPATGIALSPDQVIAALAREGVGVYASPSATTPVEAVSAPAVPIRVLSSQTVTYAAETKDHSGTLGSAIATMLPMPAGPKGSVYPPFDYLLAAYAASGHTPGEVLAGQLLGHQDWEHPGTIVFPDLVLTLFSADASRAAEQGQKSAAGALEAGPTPALSSLCSTLANWVSSGFSSVFNALAVGPSSNAVLNFLGGLWNTAVSLARAAISTVATALDPVLGVVRAGIATIGVVGWAVSTLRNLQVTSVATPPYNSFGVDPAPAKSGTLTITVGNANGFDWPQAVSQCADDLGVALPSLNSVVGRTVTWALTQANSVPTSSWCQPGQSCVLATEDASLTSTSLRSDHTADFAYTTNVEPADQASRGEAITADAVLVEATVSLDTAKLESLVKGLVLGALPGRVGVTVGPLYSSLTNGVLGQIASLAQPKFFRFVLIEHHQVPAPLPGRTCDGLLGPADFPGTTQPDPTVAIDGGTECLNSNANGKGPLIGGDGLFVQASNKAAQEFYAGMLADFRSRLSASLSPVSNVGDEAVIGTGCVVGACGPLGVVRVANDVLWVAANVGITPSTLLNQAVSELCPDCKFPTASS